MGIFIYIPRLLATVSLMYCFHGRFAGASSGSCSKPNPARLLNENAFPLAPPAKLTPIADALQDDYQCRAEDKFVKSFVSIVLEVNHTKFYACAGASIAHNRVMTSAHCIQILQYFLDCQRDNCKGVTPGTEIKILALGGSDINNPTFTTEVTEAHNEPHYKGFNAWTSNVGILYLLDSVDCHPACIATKDYVDNYDLTLLGRSLYNCDNIYTRVQQAKGILHKVDEMEVSFGVYPSNTVTIIGGNFECAKSGLAGYAGPRDCGAPVFYEEDGQIILVGIHSTYFAKDNDCPVEYSPEFFTRSCKFPSFVREYVPTPRFCSV